MSILTKALSEFDENDVEALDNALRKFADYKKQRPSGLPDYSPGFVAYMPVMSFALLKSQAAVEKLTRRIIILSCVLAALAVAQIVTGWLVTH
jgi:hypothetical protein